MESLEQTIIKAISEAIDTNVTRGNSLTFLGIDNYSKRSQLANALNTKFNVSLSESDLSMIYTVGQLIDYLSPIIERQLNRDAAELEMCLGIQKVLKANETQMTDLLSEEVKPLKENFDETYKTLYPRTYKIRKEIIENTDFSMDKVTPKRSYYEKIKLAEPEQGWKSIYPRSYENRCRLIGTDRIGKSGTVSWLKKKVWNMFFVKKHDMVKCFLRIG